MSYVEPFNRAEIIELAKAAYDPDYYDQAWALKRFMLGDYDYTKNLKDQVGKSRGRVGGRQSDIMPVYGDLDDAIGNVGVQNHAFVNSRINVWNTIFAVPDFDSDLPDPAENSWNDGFMRMLWEAGNWSAPLSDCGFSYEATGTGFVRVGMHSEGRPQLVYQDVHDTLWDFTNRNPADWSWALFRIFISVKDALKKYGHLWWDEAKTPEENAKIATEKLGGLASKYSTSGGTNSGTFKMLVEWEFWHKGAHCVFLGSLGGSGLMLNFQQSSDANGPVWRYEFADGKDGKSSDAMAGENPFKQLRGIPWIVFTDTTFPNVRRPIGKKKTSIGPTALANRLERAMERIVANMPALNLLSTGALEPEIVKKLKAAMDGNDSLSLDQLGEVLLVDADDVKDAILRVPGMPLDQTLIQLRAMMKQEINAAEGVDDASRGQRNASERITAEEIRRFADVQGGQADHMRKQYSLLMSQLWTVVRRMASEFFWYTGAFNFTNQGKVVRYDLSRYPVKDFLKKECRGTVVPESIMAMSDNAKEEKRARRFATFDAPGIKMGILNGQAIYQELYQTIYGIDITPYLQQGPPMPTSGNIPPEAEADIKELQGTAKQT